MAHTPSIASAISNENKETDDKFLKIVKNITSKGFVRSNLEEKLVDLSDVRINLKTKKLNSYIPGYTCDDSTTFQINCGSGGYGSWNISSNGILCNSDTELKFINYYRNPVYRLSLIHI